MSSCLRVEKFCFSLLLASIALASAALAAEPSGGQSGQENAVPVGRARTFSRGLPWPDPNPADIARLKAELRGELNDKFTLLNVGPWVVATDMDSASAADFCDGTIAKFAAAIQRQLFTKTPRSEPAKVYLFKDRESYLYWNKKLFHEEPGTPYGYYSRARKALVMNIGTGGGTLLHEMVHGMAEVDFPGIPAWLNEGLGSLFEASSVNAAGKVTGITNWRLSGLQKDLAQKTATHIADLLVMDDETFYGERSGSNYAAARYVMQWLQQQGKLEDFYLRVRDKKDTDALVSLRAVFDDKLTVAEIEQRCYDWVKGLTFRR